MVSRDVEFGPTDSLVRQGRTYLDLEGCRRLRALTDDGWNAVAASTAQPPAGGTMLASIELRYRIPFRRSQPEARISTLTVPGGNQTTEVVSMNEDDLFDVTKLDLL